MQIALTTRAVYNCQIQQTSQLFKQNNGTYLKNPVAMLLVHKKTLLLECTFLCVYEH